MSRYASYSLSGQILNHILQVKKLSVLVTIFLLTLITNVLILIAILSLKQKVS